MAERIVKRKGHVEKRHKAHENLAEVGLLKSTYKASKNKVDELSEVLEFERGKLSRVNVSLEEARESLLAVEEEIDADYLPEGAQPKARIQSRDRYLLMVAQLEAALDAQKKGTSKAFDNVTEAERKLFESDRNLHQFVDVLEDTELAIATQAELDRERLVVCHCFDIICWMLFFCFKYIFEKTKYFFYISSN